MKSPKRHTAEAVEAQAVKLARHALIVGGINGGSPDADAVEQAMMLSAGADDIARRGPRAARVAASAAVNQMAGVDGQSAGLPLAVRPPAHVGVALFRGVHDALLTRCPVGASCARVEQGRAPERLRECDVRHHRSSPPISSLLYSPNVTSA